MTIFTIGYEGMSIDAFMSLLALHGIETVVDIRELPLSRKPGFSKTSLANTLNLSGFEYVHMASLGCPKPVRDRYRANANWAQYTEGFLQYLETQDSALAKLSELATTSNCALLCYEADHNFCHRTFVAKAVQRLCEATVSHITKTAALRTKRPAVAQPAFV